MHNNIIWTVEGRINEGKKTLFNEVMQDMIAATLQEAGSLNYEWSLSEDGKNVHVYERYIDADAALSHMAVSWQQFSARFMEAVDITRITTFSKLTPELKTAFANAQQMLPIAGYTK